MFPYSSGNLHLGHLRNYILNDINNRWKKLINNFISPVYMGWDCFGTPAENISISKNIFPSLWIKNNIYKMKSDIKKTYIQIKWKNEIFTCKKNFYYFNYFLLLNLLKKKLIYLDNKIVNWDFYEKTILSNEQVVNGKGWRSGYKIKKINFLTYYIKLSFYKKELLYELNNLEWPEENKTIQKNWIYKEKGYIYKYHIVLNYKLLNFFLFIKKFNFINHYFFFLKKNKFLIKLLMFFFNFKKILKKNILKNYFFLNLGFKLFNNINFINNELLMYFFKNNFKKNSDSIFKKFIKLKKFFLIFLNFYLLKIDNFYKFYFKLKKFFIYSYKWNLLDWGVSRQKYWGSPIPSYNCKLCKKIFFNLNKKFLLPKNLKSSNKVNILKKNKFFSTIICKFCKNFSFMEPETLDTFFDSSWYYFFYFFCKKFFLKINKWFPMNLYIGGIEHSNLHLLYTRFITKFLRDEKLIIFGEPCIKLISQGMVLNKTYYNLKNKNIIWHNKDEIYKKNNNKKEFFSKINKKKILIGKPVKMSKSKKNGINLTKIMKLYGISPLRAYIICFPIKDNFFWNKKNFLKKIFYFKKFLKKIFFLKKKKKIFFFKKNKLCYNDKILFIFFNKNLKKILYFYNSYNYNKILSFSFNFINLLKKIKINKLFLINYFIFNNIKIIEPIIPEISYKFIKYFNYKKYLYKIFFYKINLKFKINYLLILNNRKKFFFFIIKKNLIKKRLINLLIFIKKNNKINFIIFFFKKIINIIIKF